MRIALGQRRVAMPIPNDPIILLSYINTQLRDFYPTIDELCKSLCVDKEDIEQKLNAVGYVYNEESNRFV